MTALAEFETIVTFYFTPEHLGIALHHSSASQGIEGCTDFCAAMGLRYAPARSGRQVCAE